MPAMTSAASPSRSFQTIGVLGLGTMGAGIAEVFARHGYAVVGVEKDEDALARGREYLEHSTTRAVSREKLTEAEDPDGLEGARRRRCTRHGGHRGTRWSPTQ